MMVFFRPYCRNSVFSQNFTGFFRSFTGFQASPSTIIACPEGPGLTVHLTELHLISLTLSLPLFQAGRIAAAARLLQGPGR
jgi:hypothetical protein